MPYIGNDVVDLKEPANTDRSRDSRFLKKILTDAEIEFVKNAENRQAAVWSLWTCKETAYKVINKSFPDAAFLPRRWPVTFTGTQVKYSDGEVAIPEKGKIYIRLFSKDHYIHCVGADARTALEKLIWSVERLPEEKGMNPSLYLRHCLAKSLAKHFALNFHQIKIKRTKINGQLQPPRVYVDGIKTDIDISLSHDGHFVAYTFFAADGRIEESIQ